jgi:hypothetical protein
VDPEARAALAASDTVSGPILLKATLYSFPFSGVFFAIPPLPLPIER